MRQKNCDIGWLLSDSSSKCVEARTAVLNSITISLEHIVSLSNAPEYKYVVECVDRKGVLINTVVSNTIELTSLGASGC